MAEFTEIYEDVIDRTDWEKGGEWEGEPDKVVWVDEDTGLDCMAKRHHTWGNWCGYVGVTEDHTLHGTNYSECLCGGICDTAIESDGYWCMHTPEAIFAVHHSLTFSGSCQEDASRELGICHIPQDGRPDNVWWFGFDCGHFGSGDYAPGAPSSMKSILTAFRNEAHSYKNLEYVIKQCELLAAQLKVYGEEGELYTQTENDAS